VPLRLVVPRWYGCACIKWENEIALLDDDAAATPQMGEFAGRTHQHGSPTLAREFLPAEIDHAAMPIRIEKWRIADRVVYRVFGLLWGGSRPTNALEIRFADAAPFVPVEECPMQASTTQWTVWSHLWRPAAPGEYRIVLRIGDRTLRTRRLDRSFYARRVTIDQV
jgi:DMSO/TMAO reductase YedYZ molybdopterin-dependent catalytic subunit